MLKHTQTTELVVRGLTRTGARCKILISRIRFLQVKRDPQENAQTLYQIADAQGGYFTAGQARQAGYAYSQQHFHVGLTSDSPPPGSWITGSCPHGRDFCRIEVPLPLLIAPWPHYGCPLSFIPDKEPMLLSTLDIDCPDACLLWVTIYRIDQVSPVGRPGQPVYLSTGRQHRDLTGWHCFGSVTCS
jgi:hypothetical protein